MTLLLPIHIPAGILALVCATGAVLFEKGRAKHIISGRIYFWSMAIIFATAIPMSLLTRNVFLFLVAIFSFYLAFAGYRFAVNRKGIPATFDWLAAGFMIFSGLGMACLSIIYFTQGNSQFITLAVFGGLAIALGTKDVQSHRQQTAVGKERIVRHLTNMMGGTIAVVTAVLVVNVDVEPVWIWWVLPTALITPIILWWSRKTRS